jgi:hypothetical protein
MTISTPISNKTTMMGMSHHFLRSFKKLQRSFKNSMAKYLWQFVAGGNGRVENFPLCKRKYPVMISQA